MQSAHVDGIEVPVGSHRGKRVVLGCDHRGFAYKQQLMFFLQARHPVVDVGCYSDKRWDYPGFSDEIGRRVAENPLNTVGIGICGSGIGILIPASKHRGVYVARCLNPAEAETSRRHNNSNVLGIGADCVDLETALSIVHAWIATPFYSDPKKEEAYLRRFVQTVKLEDALRNPNAPEN